MQTYDGIAPAANAAQRLVLMGTTGLPAEIADKLASYTGVGGKPVDLIVGFAEAVYANRDVASAEAKEVATGCATFAESLSFHGMGEASRGTKIARVLDGQEVSGAPAPKAEWQLAPPAAEPTNAEAFLASEEGRAAFAAWQAANGGAETPAEAS